MLSNDHGAASTSPVLSAHSDADFPSGSNTSRNTIPAPAVRFSYSVVKRAIDLCIVTLLAPIWLPLCLLLAFLVMLSSPGPIFFSHRRVGRGGVFFSMWKFRTMCQNSAEVLERHLASNPEDRAEWLSAHKLKNDPRVTPLGKFLRRSSLDELPQIWNVLTGRMTLVGPRPIVAAEAEKYGADFPYYLAVKPGITGLWQTSGRSTLSYEERVSLDRQYVEEWSLGTDAKLLLRTLTKVANSDGAY